MGFSNVADEKFADRKHVTLQDLFSLPTFQNHVLLANLSVTDESGENQAEIVESEPAAAALNTDFWV